MKIDTSRFGKLEVDKSDVIVFREGLLRFERLRKFFIVDPGDRTLILWLQSIEDNTVAFPILEPKIFKPDYSIKLLPAELAALKLEGLVHASVYTILTIPKEVTNMSANLKAPVIINVKTNEARQTVLQDNSLEVRYSMYAQLKQYMAKTSSDKRERKYVRVAAERGGVQENPSS